MGRTFAVYAIPGATPGCWWFTVLSTTAQLDAPGVPPVCNSCHAFFVCLCFCFWCAHTSIGTSYSTSTGNGIGTDTGTSTGTSTGGASTSVSVGKSALSLQLERRNRHGTRQELHGQRARHGRAPVERLADHHEGCFRTRPVSARRARSERFLSSPAEQAQGIRRADSAASPDDRSDVRLGSGALLFASEHQCGT